MLRLATNSHLPTTLPVVVTTNENSICSTRHLMNCRQLKDTAIAGQKLMAGKVQMTSPLLSPCTLPIDISRKYDTVKLYSDTCGGQNINKIIVTAILWLLNSAKTIKIVEQKFFESGHSHMECDYAQRN